jgi:3-dehydroquinate synthase
VNDPEHLEVDLGDRSYSIFVGSGLLERAAEYIDIPERGTEVIAVVADAAVEVLHGDRLREGLAHLGVRIHEFAIEPGERSKSITEAGALWRWLAGTGVHRNDPLIAFGGGVTGDLGGFVAATYHRGMPLIQVPTTLLAQVDAAIGGKTAIDLPEGKNLVGAFHQPRAVIADVSTLQTLPDTAFVTGLAEVIKHALIDPGDLLGLLGGDRERVLAREEQALTTLVARAAAVKVRIVEEDETEQGTRAFLNYGHTLAHALETVGGYEKITHGQAVAIGMMFAAHLGAALGEADRVAEHRASLDAFGLATGGAGFDYETVADAWKRDKKYEAGMRFVLLHDLGRPFIARDIPEETLRRAYEAVR